jgi:hypothetical protein
VVEIQTALAEVSSHRSVRKNLPWKESENAWFLSYLPLWLREEGERKTLSKEEKECEMVISTRQKKYL